MFLSAVAAHLRHRLDALAAHRMQHRERRAGGTLAPALQLREITGRDVRHAGEHGLAAYGLATSTSHEAAPRSV